MVHGSLFFRQSLNLLTLHFGCFQNNKTAIEIIDLLVLALNCIIFPLPLSHFHSHLRIVKLMHSILYGVNRSLFRYTYAVILVLLGFV